MAKKVKTKKKIFKNAWAFEPLEEFEDFFTKRMFGGLAVYTHGKMVLMLAESPGDYEYRGVAYPFEVWNGVLFPTYFEFHESLQKEFPSLVNHPILGKWLYLPEGSIDFNQKIFNLVENIVNNDERFGIFPKVD